MDLELQKLLIQILEGQTSLKDEVKKNSFKLESIESKLNILAEVQTAHKEQNTNEFIEVNKNIVEKTDLIETAVKSISKDTKEIKESIDVLKEMTGKHEVDINILKKRPS